MTPILILVSSSQHPPTDKHRTDFWRYALKYREGHMSQLKDGLKCTLWMNYNTIAYIDSNKTYKYKYTTFLTITLVRC